MRAKACYICLFVWLWNVLYTSTSLTYTPLYTSMLCSYIREWKCIFELLFWSPIRQLAMLLTFSSIFESTIIIIIIIVLIHSFVGWLAGRPVEKCQWGEKCHKAISKKHSGIFLYWQHAAVPCHFSKHFTNWQFFFLGKKKKPMLTIMSAKISTYALMMMMMVAMTKIFFIFVFSIYS